MSKKIVDSELVIRNKTVIEFYKHNSYLDFEQVNLLLVNFLSNIIQEADNGINKGLSMQILQQCSDSNVKVELMSKDLLIRMMDLKKEYLDDLKSQMTNYDGKISDKLSKQLELNTEILIGKTNTTLSTIVLPTISDNVRREMNESVNLFKNELMSEISKIKNKDFDIEEFIQNVDKRFQHQNDDFKQMMTSFTNELASKVAKTDITLDELRDYFSKFSNSSLKGGLGENRLAKTLTKMFPTGEVLDTSNIKESGDIHLKRENKETILFETKEYVKNVGPAEVEKFIRDCTIQNLHGIFLSQNSGISSKNNLRIDYNNGKILVYVHYCEYCPDKIQMALDIIDSLSSKILENNQENIHIIPNEILDEINTEYKRVIDQRNYIISTIEKNNSTIIKLVKESIRLPKLEAYLEDKYGQVKKTSFVCHICERAFENRSGLASHLKAHNKKENASEASISN
jgi:hypothetical protein